MKTSFRLNRLASGIAGFLIGYFIQGLSKQFYFVLIVVGFIAVMGQNQMAIRQFNRGERSDREAYDPRSSYMLVGFLAYLASGLMGMG